MKKMIQFSATIIVAFLMMSSKPHYNNIEKAEPFPVYVPVSETFYFGGCSINITTTIAFIFDDETYQLLGAALSGNYYIQINCGGPPSNYARSGSEISFDVSHGDVSDVHFPTTGIRDLDDLFSDTNFKNDFLEMVNNKKPY